MPWPGRCSGSAWPSPSSFYLKVHHGDEFAELFLAGYILEKSLSVDNLMVFVAIFASFGIKGALQHRILYFGISGRGGFPHAVHRLRHQPVRIEHLDRVRVRRHRRLDRLEDAGWRRRATTRSRIIPITGRCG